MSKLVSEKFQHRTVLLHEAINALAIDGSRVNGTYVDGTFGCGGHSRKILQSLGPKGRLIAFDRDPRAIISARAIIDPRFEIVHASFRMMVQTLQKRGIQKVDGVLFDLGISSPQVDDASRGFSFRADGPLDMRMDTTHGISAAEWLLTADERTIRKVVCDYGEERFAVQIAKAIVASRIIKPITRTKQLAKIVASAVKTREKGKNPATRTFQAIRIFINQELKELEVGLDQAFQQMAEQGKLVVISFHSLEDRLVKQFMLSKAKLPKPIRCLPIRILDLSQPKLKLVAKVKPLNAEIMENPRARSAIMRVGERLGTTETFTSIWGCS